MTLVTTGQFTITDVNDAIFVPNILKWYEQWTVGSSLITGWINYGDASENVRASLVDPFGFKSTIWRCVPDADGGASGGFTVVPEPIDPAKLYRYTCFVKRVGDGVGTIEHGCGGVKTMAGDTVTTGIFYDSSTLNIGEWYLLVGFIHPESETTPINKSGIYSMSGRLLAAGNEYKFASGVTPTLFTRLTGGVNAVSEYQLFNPTFERIDGTEETIADLVHYDASEFDYLTDVLKHGETTIEGGLLTTNLIQAAGMDKVVRSGISGLAEDNIGFWTGGSYQDALSEKASNIIHKDGSIRLGGGALTYDKADNKFALGDFRILNGEIIGLDSNSKERVRMSRSALPEIGSISQGWAYFSEGIIGGHPAMIVGDEVDHLPSDKWVFANRVGTLDVYKPFTLEKTIVVAAPSQIRLEDVQMEAWIYNVDPEASTITATWGIYNASTGAIVYPSGGPVSTSTAISVGAAGTYKLKVNLNPRITNGEPESLDPFQKVFFEASFRCSAISFQGIHARSMIGQDGIMSWFSATSYLYYKESYGFEARFGSMGIRITSQGIEKMINGVSWTADTVTNEGTITAMTYNNHVSSELHLTQAQRDVLAMMSVVSGELKVTGNIYATGSSSALGIGVGGGGTAYDRLDTWASYDSGKAGWVLSAALGYDLHGRVSTLESSTPNIAWGVAGSGYIPLAVNGFSHQLSTYGHTHTKSSITDFAHTLGSHSDVTLTTLANGNILKYNGSKWVNNTLAQAGIATPADIDTAINGIEIGGRNLIPVNTGIWESGSIAGASGGNATSTTRLRTIGYINAESNQDYYLSIYSDHKIALLAYDASGTYIGYLGSQIWITGSTLLKTPSNTARLRFVLAKNDDSTIGLSDLSYVKIKLEKGNKATDWTPAPEDVDASIATVQTNLTTHTALTNNPHGVTASQLGLGSVNNTADSEKNVLSATKLTTARTLWGQSFDGTANVAGDIKEAVTVEAYSFLSRRAMYYMPANGAGWYRIATYEPTNGDQSMNAILMVDTGYKSAFPETHKVLVSAVYNIPKISILESTGQNVIRLTKFRVTSYQVGTYTYRYAIDVYYTLNSTVTQILKVSGSIGSLVIQTPVLYTAFDTDGHALSVEVDTILNCTVLNKLKLVDSISATTAILSNLTAGYVPYHTAGGLVNGPIAVTGNNVSTAGNLTLSSADGTFMQIGGGRLVWDNTNNALKVIKADGTAANFYATGSNSAQGIGTGGGGASYDMVSDWSQYVAGSELWVVSAELINALRTSVTGHIGDSTHASAGEKSNWNAAYSHSVVTGGVHMTSTDRSQLTTAYNFANGFATAYPDLTAIEAITGTSGLLKKTAANTWSLDTNTYITGITKAMVEAVLTGGITSHTHAYDAAGTAAGAISAHNATYNHDHIANGQTAYGWGNHASVGYLTAISVADIPEASATASGIVTTGSQTFAGEKWFASSVWLAGSNALVLDGATQHIYSHEQGEAIMTFDNGQSKVVHHWASTFEYGIAGSLDIKMGTALTFGLDTMPSGSIRFANGADGNQFPSIVGKSASVSTGTGLFLAAGSTDTNTTSDMLFSVRRHDNADFTDISKVAFRWSRYATNLMTLARNGLFTLMPATNSLPGASQAAYTHAFSLNAANIPTYSTRMTGSGMGMIIMSMTADNNTGGADMMFNVRNAANTDYSTSYRTQVAFRWDRYGDTLMSLARNGALTVAGTASVTGLLTATGNIATANVGGAYVQIGPIKIVYDATNNALRFEGNVYATGSNAAFGVG